MAAITLHPAEVARLRRTNEACETVRAAAYGETVGADVLAAAEAVIAEACRPLSYDEQQHRLAMSELVAEANRTHRLTFGYR